MNKVVSKQITIKDIPKNVNNFLHQKAKREKKSLNQVIIECLESARLTAQSHKKTGAAAADTWPDDPRLKAETAYLDILDAEL